MRFCPTCQTRYDEEILRFCTKDGTPLLEEEKPNFTTLPSESVADDADEETVIRRNPPKPIAAPELPKVEETAPRIVIPTTQRIKEQQVRTKTAASYRQPPPPANTGKIVLLTILGTLIVLMGGGIIYLFLSRESSTDSNQNRIINANFNSIDMNLNANLNAGNALSNFNFDANSMTDSNINANLNLNLNAKTNANLKTPTPTPKATATPVADTNENSDLDNLNTATPTPNVTPRPTGTPRPNITPRPTGTPSPSPSLPSNRPVNAGILNGRAVTLPKPAYPPLARQMRASGQVAVQISVDESGNVTAARATSGNSLLRLPAEAAARQSKFNPIIVGNQAVRATGILVYNFNNQ